MQIKITKKERQTAVSRQNLTGTDVGDLKAPGNLDLCSNEVQVVLMFSGCSQTWAKHHVLLVRLYLPYALLELLRL